LGDVPRLVAMGREQLVASYGDAVADNPAQLEALAEQLITVPAATVFVAEQDGVVVGMIGLVVAPHHFSGRLTAGEIMWWVDPAARGIGLRLLRRAEAWALERGAAVMQVVAPARGDGARVGQLYERRGYRAVETSYQRTVSGGTSEESHHAD
jgi:GNAT superfamily N-acetyltransferase